MNLWHEKRLLTAFRRRDPSAFDALFALHGGTVLGFALRLTRGCRSDAEELVSETFVAAYQGAPHFRGSAKLSTYLMGITLRRWKDRQRRAPQETVSLVEETHTTSTGEVASVTALAIRQAAQTLPRAQWDAFQLVVVEGLTHKEAAALLGIPLGTLKWRVAEAIRQIRLALEDPK